MAVSALGMWALSVPGSYFFPLLAAIMGAIVLVVTWVFLAFGYLGGHGWRRALRDRWTIATGLLIIAATAAVFLELPFRARFEASRPALESAALAMLADPRAPTREFVEIGWFTLERVERIDGRVRFLVADTGFLDLYGLVFSTTGQPADLGEDIYWPVVDEWSMWRESW